MNEIKISRRLFTTGTIASLAMPALVGRALADDEVRLAAILDLSGGFDIYGKPLKMAMEMAVDEINQSGGLNGKQIRMITYDAQSNMQLYAQYAQQAALQDKAHVVHTGATSASREAVRPILHKYKTLYLYSGQYEGGVCDRNTFCTGTTPIMSVKEPIKWAIENYGPKIYSIGADYNAPRIFGELNAKYGKEAGGVPVANDFFPLPVTEFGPLITKIQKTNPDFIASCLVGAPHVGFYRQWAAAGMLGKIPILSYTFGAGNEHKLLPVSETEGITAPYSYFEELTNPINVDWVKRYHTRYGSDAPYMGCISFGGYEGTWLWATAVRKAGTEEREAVIHAMEDGVSWDGPGGKLAMVGKLHHCSRDISLGKCTSGAWQIVKSWSQQYPGDTEGQCDLIANPETNKQFMPI